MKIAFITTFQCLILVSCFVSRGNYYSYLNEEDQEKIKKLETFNDLNKDFIYEITADQLLIELEKHKKSLVYIFTSGCSGASISSLSEVEKYAEQNNLKLFLILTGYWQLNQTLDQDINSQLYAINASDYGNPNKGGYTTKFRNDLGYKDYYKTHKKGGSFMYFQGKLLQEMKHSIVDSY